MRPVLSRRSFLAAGAGALGLAGTARAIEPLKRTGKPLLRLSLAAYSMKKYLAAAPGKPGAMDMGGFVDYCAKLRLDGAELTSYWFPKTVTGAYLAGLKRRAHLAGVDISGGAIANRFTTPPGDASAKQQAHVRTWIDHYADLGAPVIRVFAGGRPGGVSEADAVKNCIANFEQACEYAGKRGVILGLENHDMTSNVDLMLKIVRGVKSRWFGVTLDSGNFHSDDAYADLAKIAPYTVNAQIKVAIRNAGKKEPADYKRIVRVLRDANYSGFVTLEYEERADAYKGVPEHIERLRAAIRAGN